MEQFGFQHSRESADFIGEKVSETGLAMPEIAVVLGSGLKSYAERYTHPDNRLVIPTHQIPNFPKPQQQASGHNGELIIAPIAEGSSETVAIWAGRVHFYQNLLQKIEGNWTRITDPEVRKAAVGFYVAICAQLGIQDILTSNAVGSSDSSHRVGDIVRVSDHIIDGDDDFGVPEEESWFEEKKRKLLADGKVYEYGSADYFYGQGGLYSGELGALASGVAGEQGWKLTEAVLNWRRGRGYETPAYTKSRHAMGATLFGMSTGPEAVKARSIGFNNEPGGRHFASFSLVTNVAQLEADQKIDHGAVSAAGRSNEGSFNPFMHELVVRRRAEKAA